MQWLNKGSLGRMVKSVVLYMRKEWGSMKICLEKEEPAEASWI